MGNFQNLLYSYLLLKLEQRSKIFATWPTHTFATFLTGQVFISKWSKDWLTWIHIILLVHNDYNINTQLNKWSKTTKTGNLKGKQEMRRLHWEFSESPLLRELHYIQVWFQTSLQYDRLKFDHPPWWMNSDVPPSGLDCTVDKPLTHHLRASFSVLNFGSCLI